MLNVDLIAFGSKVWLTQTHTHTKCNHTYEDLWGLEFDTCSRDSRVFLKTLIKTFPIAAIVLISRDTTQTTATTMMGKMLYFNVFSLKRDSTVWLLFTLFTSSFPKAIEKITVSTHAVVNKKHSCGSITAGWID